MTTNAVQMLCAVHNNSNYSRPTTRGSVVLILLVVFGVGVMLAAVFVGLMASYRSSGIQQGARQLAAQTASAGAAYAEGVLRFDYADARNQSIPQRYNSAGISGTVPETRGNVQARPGPVPNTAASRVGLMWSLAFQGRSSNDASNISGTSQKPLADNQTVTYQLPNALHANVITDATRPSAIDSLDNAQDPILQYMNWNNGWYYSTNVGSVQTLMHSVSSLSAFMTPYSNGTNRNNDWLARPKWFTTGYYDSEFRPLPLTDRNAAAFEARFCVFPIPLDGCLNLNFDDNILSDGPAGDLAHIGAFRLGFRTNSVNTSPRDAASLGQTIFNNDAQENATAPNPPLRYIVGSTTNIDLDDVQYQAYPVHPIDDIDWVGTTKDIPLAQQYAASLANMFAVMPMRDRATQAVQKMSDIAYTPPSTFTYAIAAQNSGLPVGAVGELTSLVNAALGQGYQGNLYGYDSTPAPPLGDPWYRPSGTPRYQTGMPATWRQLHANLGILSQNGNNLRADFTALVSGKQLTTPIVNFVVSPFGKGISASKGHVPDRNLPSSDVADIDCPWYVNIMMVNQFAAKAMICGMDATWFNSLSVHGIQGYNNQTGDLLPTPPDKTDPILGTHVARWDDGMAKTGADGVEAGAIPPCVVGFILTTGYKQPPITGAYASPSGALTDPNYPRSGTAAAGIVDSFLRYDVWRNPIRDEVIRPQSAGTGYLAPPYVAPAWGTTIAADAAYGMIGMDNVAGSLPYDGRCGEDQAHQFAIGGQAGYEALRVENIRENLGSVASWSTGVAYVVGNYVMNNSNSYRCAINHTSGSFNTDLAASRWTIVYGDEFLDSNQDHMDERLSLQNDIIAALLHTMVDCHFDRKYGIQLNGTLRGGYEKIEDVDTVFLGYLGIAVSYEPALSKASTKAVTIDDYYVYPNGAKGKATAVVVPTPGAADARFKLGKFNQLCALSQVHSEIGLDRTGATTADGNNIITGGGAVAGQMRYRFYTNKVVWDGSTYRPNSTTVRVYPGPGWPSDYTPTWASLSRIMEHRINDVRMSLFGTPALDLNQDTIVDATTLDGTGEVTDFGPYDPAARVARPKQQLHFSSTGRFYLGRNHYWRLFIRSEIWDRRADKLASESTVERVYVIDPNGDGTLTDSQSIYNRWHENKITTGRQGPTAAGRNELTP